MNIQDVTTRIQRTFGDEAAVQVSQSDVYRWINDAQREACMQHENLLQKVAYVTGVVGQNEYSLPTDCLTVNGIYYRESSSATVSYYKMQFLSISDFNDYCDGWSGPDYGNGLPQVYTRGDTTEGKFVVFPPPDAAYTNAFKINYARYPTDVASLSDPIDLPVYYHNYVVEFCLMKAYEMDEDWDSAGKKAAYVQAALDFNNNREGWFGRESYPTVSARWEDSL